MARQPGRSVPAATTSASKSAAATALHDGFQRAARTGGEDDEPGGHGAYPTGRRPRCRHGLDGRPDTPDRRWQCARRAVLSRRCGCAGPAASTLARRRPRRLGRRPVGPRSAAGLAGVRSAAVRSARPAADTPWPARATAGLPRTTSTASQAAAPNSTTSTVEPPTAHHRSPTDRSAPGPRLPEPSALSTASSRPVSAAVAAASTSRGNQDSAGASTRSTGQPTSSASASTASTPGQGGRRGRAAPRPAAGTPAAGRGSPPPPTPRYGLPIAKPGPVR